MIAAIEPPAEIVDGSPPIDFEEVLFVRKPI